MVSMIDMIEQSLSRREISEEDAESLRLLCANTEESISSLKTQHKELNKQCLKVGNDVLAAKVLLEKTKIQESEELRKVNKTDELRNIAHRDLEIAEHKEIVAKFELQEVKLAHDELRATLENVKKENLATIDPILDTLQQEIRDLKNQLILSESIIKNDTTAISHMEGRLQNLEVNIHDKQQLLSSRKDYLMAYESKPEKLAIKNEALNKIIATAEGELKALKKKLQIVEAEAIKLTQRTFDAETMQKGMLEKVTTSRSTVAKREQEILIVKSNLEILKTQNHDLLTKKVEVNLQKKEIESEYRYQSSQFSLIKREYENSLRQLKKKRKIFDQVKEVIPSLEDQLSNEALYLKIRQGELMAKAEELNKLKEDIDIIVADFMQQAGLEAVKKQELNNIMDEVDELEEDVLQIIMENKRLSSIVASLSAQRDKKVREKVKIELLLKDAQQHSKIKELNILDLTKRCNEMSNRLKEFLALYEIVKNERNKYVNLIQGSNQALTEMKEKVRILFNEMEILGNESHAKDLGLNKERSTHTTAKNNRDQLRHEINYNMSIYKQKQAVLEAQILEIDKLNSSIKIVEKEMLELKQRFEEATNERNKVGVQLIERNDELTVLHEKSNQQLEALKNGKLELLRRVNEMRLIKIQTEELQQKYTILVKKVPLKSEYSAKMEEIEKRIENEKQKAYEFSLQLENPQNLERWRALEGDDPDVEILNSKINQLEKRVDVKRDELLEKEIVIEELTALNIKLQNQIDSKSVTSTHSTEQLHEVQTRLKDITRKMMATVSELSMYQSCALQLQQEKEEKAKLVDIAKSHITNGEPPTDEAIKDWIRLEKRIMVQTKLKMEESYSMKNNTNNFGNSINNGNNNSDGDNNFLNFEQDIQPIKTTAEPRPTAYIPEDLLGIPKPYGNQAPFKPSTLGASMRQHIRNPNPKPIEM